MDRRAFITLLGGSLVSGPLVSEAQQADSVVRRIGLVSTSPGTSLIDSWWDAFIAGMREKGWVEEKNFVIIRRFTAPQKEAALAVAEDLVRGRVDVIVVGSTLAALAGKPDRTTVPIE